MLGGSSCSLTASNLGLLSWGGKREAAPQHPAQPPPPRSRLAGSGRGPTTQHIHGRKRFRRQKWATPHPDSFPPPPFCFFSSNPQAAGSEEPAWPGSWHSHTPRWRGGDRARRLHAHSLQPSRGGCQNARGISALRCLRGPKTPLHPPQRWALTRPHCTSSLPCRKRGNLDSPSARGCVKKVQLRPSTGTAARSV